MMHIGIKLKITANVVLVLMLINVIEIKAESSGGFRGKVVEKIGKSPHKIVHSIEVKSSDQSQVNCPDKLFQVLPTLRDSIVLNRRPGEQILQSQIHVNISCLQGWKEPDCQTCAQGWKEPDCQTCVQGWKQPDCQTCAQGWTGPECDVCEKFGFSEESECIECIHNGYWTGKWDRHWLMTAVLTFEGPTCNNLVPGTIVHYSGSDRHVILGNYDNRTNTLRWTRGRNPQGQVDVLSKRISGTLRYSTNPFYLNYQVRNNLK